MFSRAASRLVSRAFASSTGVVSEVEKQTAVLAVKKACHLCLSVQSGSMEKATLSKTDASPVTVADFAVQALIIDTISRVFPSDKFVAEEEAKDLRDSSHNHLLGQVVAEINKVNHIQPLSTCRILEALDLGAYDPAQPLDDPQRYWVLDPIDGTKGFVRREQSAVALGLVSSSGQVLFGVLGCPRLPVDWDKPNGETGVVFVGGVGHPTQVLPLHSCQPSSPPSSSPPSSSQPSSSQPSSLTPPAMLSSQPPSFATVSRVGVSKNATVTESVETGHSDQQASRQILLSLGITKPIVRMDSQCKYAAVARGEADIYLRLPTRKGYQEKVWDHAAGVAVIEAAGGTVTDILGKPLDFSLGRTLQANTGVVATNGCVHEHVLKAVQEHFKAPASL